MTFLIAFNRLFDKVFLNRYADTDRETWFQVRGMALLLLAIGLCLPFALLLADDRPFLVVTISVMLVFDGLLLAAIRLGWQRFAVTGAVLGFWALVTVLVFSSPFFDRYEVYKLATFYLFILFISSLMVRRMGVTALLVALSVAAILLSSVIRGNYMPVEKDVPTPDDYFACVALVVLTLVIIRPTIDRHRRQLETVREEARERQQRAAELDAANRAIRQREEELTRLRNFLSDIIDAMPSVLVSVDDALCITRWNRQAAERMGPSAGEAMGQPIAVLMPSLADRMSRVRTAIDDGVAVSHNRDRVLTGNDVRFENMTVYPLSDPAAKGAVIRIDDVTEQVHLEELMVQNEKMRSVGGLAAGMAHEINNPLGGVLQNAAVIARRLREPIHANLAAAQEAGVDLEKMAAYLEKRQIFRMLDMVEASGLRAAEIVQHMLNFSRMAGAPAEEIRLDELLDRSLSLAATEDRKSVV